VIAYLLRWPSPSSALRFGDSEVAIHSPGSSIISLFLPFRRVSMRCVCSAFRAATRPRAASGTLAHALCDCTEIISGQVSRATNDIFLSDVHLLL
jgi:hypothetical protein